MSGGGFAIHIDRSACRGSAACIARAPATFALDAAQRSTVADPAGDPEPAIRAAARACPTFAITIEEPET